MIRQHLKQQRRGGATTVEFAVVSIVVFMFLFGIFEYGRFLFVYHVTNNAARDAARFAVVRTGGGTVAPDGTPEPATITTANVQSVATTGMFNGQRYGTGMIGMENSLVGYQVQVYAVPNSDLYSVPANLDPDGKPAWTEAAFHQKIAVRISGTYQPIVPDLLGLASDIPIVVISLAGSEAN